MKFRLNRLLNLCVIASLIFVSFLGGSKAEAAQGGHEPATIHLRAGNFHPTMGELPAIPADLTITGYTHGQPGTYLVQLAGPVLEEWKQGLAELGAEVLEYIPDFTFKVRMTPAIARLVETESYVAWVGINQPGYKVDPALDLSVERLYRVRNEKGSQHAQVANEMAQVGANIGSAEGDSWQVQANGNQIKSILHNPNVAWVEAYTVKEFHNEYGGGQIMGSAIANANGYDGTGQVVGIADTGLNTGDPNTVPGIPAARIRAIFNWPGKKTSCFSSIIDDGPQDINGHGTHTSGSILSEGINGAGRGTAPGASLVFQAMENWAKGAFLCFGRFNYYDYFSVGFPTDLRLLFQQAYDVGARVHSNSWGGDNAGDYNAESVQTDDFVWTHPDMLITFSAGNFGVDGNSDGVVDTGNQLAAPGTAKNVLTVGASENNRQENYQCDGSLTYVNSPDGTSCAQQGGNSIVPTWGVIGEDMGGAFPAAPLKNDLSAGNAQQMAAFSSRGPTDDGRIKPDLVAPGTWILSTYSDLFQQGYDTTPNPKNNAWQNGGWPYPYSQQLKYNGGTSMSNPLVAGGAAVVREYYAEAHGHNASAALVKAALINSAVDLQDENNDGVNDNALPIPNNHEGWGLVNLVNATDGSAQFIDSGVGITTATSQIYPFMITDNIQPFKVTLAWSDYPSTETASVNLVNDLDLVMTSPSGMVYRGNVFSGGWSQTGGSADRRNNVENAYVLAPETGVWTIQVNGYNIPHGPQPFALVVDGIFGELPPVPVPTAPTSLTATAVSSSQIDLAWSDNSNNETGFTVERSSDGTNFASIVTLPANTISYSDGSLPANTPYHYRVQAYNATGPSEYSNTAFTTTQVHVELSMHVQNLVGTSARSGSRWTASVTITVHDAADQALSNVVVSGTWSAGATGSSSCTTNSEGICTVSKGSIKTTVASVKFIVTNLVRSGYTYIKENNHFNEIVIPKP